MPELRKREIAYKIRIGDILRAKPIFQQQDTHREGEQTQQRIQFVELGNKKILRVNIVANVIEKYDSEGEKRFSTLTIDDASGQITIRAFGDGIELLKDISQGHTIMIVGLLRYFNNEIYIMPELVKIQDPRYLLVRKLELGKQNKENPQVINKEEVKAVKDQIIDKIKASDSEGGLDIERLIMDIKASPEIINQEIQKLLEEGLAYEPRPGKLRYLG